MQNVLKSLVLVAAAVAAQSASANLVTNGDFEAGNAGWTSVTWGSGTYDRGVHGGVRSMATGCTATDFSCTFSQTLATTAGQSYDISFWLYTDGAVDANGNTVAQYPNGLRVSFDGAIVDTIIDFATTNTGSGLAPGGPSTLITIHGVAASTGSTVLEFAGYHVPAGIFVDDISVDATTGRLPEPASLALAALALGAAGASRRAKRRAA